MNDDAIPADGGLSPLLSRLDRLNGNIESLVAATEGLAPRAEVDAKIASVVKTLDDRLKRDRFWRRIVIAVAIIFAAAMTVYTVQTHDQSRSNEAVTQEVKGLVNYANDCLRPDGACFKANRESLQKQVAAIVATIVSAIKDQNGVEQKRIEQLLCAQLGAKAPPDICAAA